MEPWEISREERGEFGSDMSWNSVDASPLVVSCTRVAVMWFMIENKDDDQE